MTENVAKKIGFGLLILGMLTMGVGEAYAQLVSTTAKGVIDFAVTQYHRNNDSDEKANERAKDTAKSQGYSSENITAYTKADEAADVQKAKDSYQGVSGNVKGALAAAGERWSSSDGILSGISNVIGGAAKDAVNMVTGKYEDVASDVANKNETVKSVVQGNVDTADAVKNVANGALVYTSGDTTIVMDSNMKAVSGIMEGCVPIPLKLEQLKSCIFCPLFLVLYNTAEAMATSSYETLAGGFKILLAIGLALYLAFITLKQVSSFTKQDAPKYITEALTITFKVFFAWTILLNGSELYRLALEPLLSAGLEFGEAFLSHTQSSGVSGATGCSEVMSTSSASSYFYSRNLYSAIDCYLRKVVQEIAVSQSIGSSLMCIARNKAAGVVMWDLTMFTTGLIMWAFAWLICLAFAFYLIDSVIRLGIIGAITPFLIASWPFKLTQQYTKKGWQMFLNAFFTFVFVGLVVSVNVELSMQAATGGSSSANETVMSLINANNVDELRKTFDIGFIGLIFMLLCCIFGFKLCGEAASLAAEMSGASGGNIGSKIGSAAAGAAKGMATRGAKLLGGAAMLAGEAIPVTVNGKKQSLSSAVRGRYSTVRDKVADTAYGAESGLTPGGRDGGGSGGATSNAQNTADSTAANQDQNQNQQTTPQSGANDNNSNDSAVNNTQANGNARTGNQANAENNGANDNVDTNTSDSSVAQAEAAAPRDSESVVGGIVAGAKGDLASAARDEAEKAVQSQKGNSRNPVAGNQGNAPANLRTERNTDSNGNQNWRTVDENGRVYEDGFENADGSSRVTAYDENGNKTSEYNIDRDNNYTYQTFDAQNNVATSITLSNDGALSTTEYNNGEVVSELHYDSPDSTPVVNNTNGQNGSPIADSANSNESNNETPAEHSQNSNGSETAGQQNSDPDKTNSEHKNKPKDDDKKPHKKHGPSARERELESEVDRNRQIIFELRNEIAKLNQLMNDMKGKSGNRQNVLTDRIRRLEEILKQKNIGF